MNYINCCHMSLVDDSRLRIRTLEGVVINIPLHLCHGNENYKSHLFVLTCASEGEDVITEPITLNISTDNLRIILKWMETVANGANAEATRDLFLLSDIQLMTLFIDANTLQIPLLYTTLHKHFYEKMKNMSNDALNNFVNLHYKHSVSSQVSQFLEKEARLPDDQLDF